MLDDESSCLLYFEFQAHLVFYVRGPITNMVYYKDANYACIII